MSNGGPCEACKAIKPFEVQMARQHEQHRELCARVNDCHDPLSTRPAEIASLIFEFVVAPFSPGADPDCIRSLQYKKGLKARFALSGVCKLWRAIAFNTPRLWTSLAVPINSPLEEQWQDKLLREWLERAKRISLSVYLYRLPVAKDTVEDDTFAHTQNLIELICTNSAPRWEVLSLHNIPPKVFPYISAIMQADKVVDSVFVNNPYKVANPVVLDLSRIRPKMLYRRLRPPMDLAVSFAELTYVHFDFLRVEDYFHVLIMAPKLQRLEVDLVNNLNSQPTLIPHIVHSELKELVIDFRLARLEAFIGILVLPSLEKLTARGPEDNLPLRLVQELLDRSSCQLKELSIEGMVYSGPDLLEFLRGLSLVEHLELKPTQPAAYDLAPLLQLFAETALSDDGEAALTSFLPRLRSFVYGVDCSYTYDWPDPPMPWALFGGVFGPLEELSNPRRRPLRSVKICFKELPTPFDIDDECIGMFIQLGKAGLEFLIDFELRI